MLEVTKVVDTVNAPIAEVWAVVEAFGALKAWMPFIQTCSVQGAGIGAIRRCKVKGVEAGLGIERLEESDAQRYRVAYRVLEPCPLPMTGAIGSIQLTALGPWATRFEWITRVESLSAPREEVAGFIEPFYHSNLRALKQLLNC